MLIDSRETMGIRIFTTSGLLIGICFLLLCILHITRLASLTVVDDLLLPTIMVFLLSSAFSYVGIRFDSIKPICENISEYLFILGLLLIVGCTWAVFEI
jgi:hypothetical protein